MPYKDSSKRKEANRKAQARCRGGDEGMTVVEGVTETPTSEGVTAGVTDVIPSGQGVTVWERGGYRGEYIDGVFCVNGKPYSIGDILDLQHAPYQLIHNLYAMKA